jgi:hypothetical protein
MPQKTPQKTWIVSKPMDDVTQMRFGANGQRTVTIGRVWAARYHGSWNRGIPTGAGN